MPEYLSPGVYVEEIEIGSKPIEGVSTSTAGFLGETERGPTEPKLVTSWLQYQRLFGSYFGEDKYFPYAVKGFFDNGGQRCYIGRIVMDGSTKASLNIPSNANYSKCPSFMVEAIGEGSWGKRIAVKLVPATHNKNGFRISIFYWGKAPKELYDPEEEKKIEPRPSVIEVFDDLNVIENSTDYYLNRVNGISNLVKLSVSSAGELNPWVVKGDGKGKGDGGKTFKLSDESKEDGTYVGMNLEVTYEEGKIQSRKIISYKDNVAEVDSAWNPKLTKDTDYSYKIIYDKLLMYLTGGTDVMEVTGRGKGDGEKTFNLPDASKEDGTYVGMNLEVTYEEGKTQNRKIISYKGNVAEVESKWEPSLIKNNDYSYKVISINQELMLNDYLRDKTILGERRGLAGFAEIDEISIVYTPDVNNIDGLSEALVLHCESLKDRFAIIDAKKSTTDVSNLDPRDNCDTKYAAFYYPWIKIVDPETGMMRTIPPGGHVAGIYARTDIERGVHKAPANEVVRGAANLEFQITKGEQDTLNPRGVNVIRAFPGRGIRVWGARTLSSDPSWKYINIRRLFIFLEESIDEACQWVVFEPNNEKLWERVKSTITEFLTRVWRDGALMGTKAEEAFFVKVDRTTMTQSEIDNGQLIVMIGVAPVKPAEFVIFRIAQWTNGSSNS